MSRVVGDIKTKRNNDKWGCWSLKQIANDKLKVMG